MKSFKHMNATSIEEAVSTLTHYEGRAALVAGGTDLIGILKDRILPRYPDVVINIKSIPELNRIKKDSEGLKIGALARLSDIAESPQVLNGYKLLSQAVMSIATPEIRNMGTIGGNLCQHVRCWYYRYPHHMGKRILCYRKQGDSCPAVRGDNRYHAIMGAKRCFAVCPSDAAIALTALEARVTIFGPEGERNIPVQELFGNMGLTLKAQEILTQIQIPPSSGPSRQTYLKYSLRNPIDFAVVSVAAAMNVEQSICNHAAIALGAMAPTPIRASKAENKIKGNIVDEDSAAAAAIAAVADAKPLQMNAYKVEITKALVKRAVLTGP